MGAGRGPAPAAQRAPAKLVFKEANARHSGSASVFTASIIPRDGISGDQSEIIDVFVDGKFYQRVPLRAQPTALDLAFQPGAAHTVTVVAVKIGERYRDVCIDLQSPGGLVPARGLHVGDSRTFEVSIER
jgi:hypothetical protein